MREIRTSGSEGGGANRPSLPLSRGPSFRFYRTAAKPRHELPGMTNTIKVLHILHAFSHGGLENGIVNLINGSPQDIRHELCLLTAAGEFIHRLKKPVTCYELHKQPGNSLGTILQLRRIIRSSGAHIVHTRNWGAFDGVIAASCCPGVVIIHGEHGRDIGDPAGLNLRRNLIRKLFSPRIRKFTAVSEDLSQWLAAKVKIPSGRILLIRNGVDTQRFRPQRDLGLRDEFGIPHDAIVIGTIGRLDPIKNHVGLIQAFADLARRFTNLRLVIVGEGPERKRLESIIRDYPKTPAPVLAGYRADVDRFYGLFDVFVLNSFAEGMSNTLLEALASGLPVVCTPAGANSELVVDGGHGRIVPVDDKEGLEAALTAYIQSDELRSAHGGKARLFIEANYSLPVMIGRYMDLYRNLSNGGRTEAFA
jgi:sugar transferase (PEP-CTERM/EpsH1 system associated)